MTITTVLLDLDGVVRHFDPAHVAGVEQVHGLEPGSLTAAAFAPDLLIPAITGEATRAEWTTSVGVAVDNPAAANAWLDTSIGELDEALLTEVDILRASGVVVAVLTNGTSTIGKEMVELDLVRRFDAIFNTFDIGFAKPDPRAFQHVAEALAVDSAEVFFTDDSASKLAGAIEIGMTAILFEGIDKFRSDLANIGLRTSE